MFGKPSIVKNFVKKIFQRTINKITNRKILDSPDNLIYIHIGKCGGASLWNAILKSNLIKTNFANIEKVHVKKPPIKKKSKYLIVIRNPIQRAISAFNWRYKLVVEQNSQRNRFEGEWEVLTKYGTLNKLAENLYENNQLNYETAANFRLIHHLKEDISFYLTDLLDSISRKQIFAIMSTENLNSDIKKYLNVKTVDKIHENSKLIKSDKKKLSVVAYNNLKKFLSKDYECIEKILEMNNSKSSIKTELMN